MWLYIKYMVSIRCKMVVKSELDKLGLRYGTIDLGKVEIEGTLSPGQREQLYAGLLQSHLELMDDEQAMLIEKIKNIIVEMIHYSDAPLKHNFSKYLSEKLDRNYNTLASLFSKTTGITIEHYIISHKIERIKELLLYDELTLKEISHLLNYSSPAHLSGQFKKITGLTPTYFKELKQYKRRTPLEDL